MVLLVQDTWILTLVVIEPWVLDQLMKEPQSVVLLVHGMVLVHGRSGHRIIDTWPVLDQVQSCGSCENQNHGFWSYCQRTKAAQKMMSPEPADRQVAKLPRRLGMLRSDLVGPMSLGPSKPLLTTVSVLEHFKERRFKIQGKKPSPLWSKMLILCCDSLQKWPSATAQAFHVQIKGRSLGFPIRQVFGVFGWW